MNNFITSTAVLTDKLLSSNFDPELKEFLSTICENLKTKNARSENLKTKDAQLIRLQNEIEYLREKVNDVEIYTSKHNIIFRNLPFLSNKDVTTDVIEFIENVLHVKIYIRGLSCPSWTRTDSGQLSEKLNLVTEKISCLLFKSFEREKCANGGKDFESR